MMSRNIEIKAKVSPATVDRIRHWAVVLTKRSPQRLWQKDTFFNASHGRLKLREFGDGTGELIAYERPDTCGPKASSYTRSAVSDPDTLREALARALGVRGIVEKSREVHLLGQTRIHLDAVQGLGWFLELEVVLRDDQSDAQGEIIANRLLAVLGIETGDLVSGAYIDLIERGDLRT